MVLAIEPKIAAAAKKYRLDPVLLQAIKSAEGNLVKAVQCSVPGVTSEDEAIDILCKSIIHRMMDFVNMDNITARDFIVYFGAKWAPLGASNDPNNLNKNWIPNVLKLWGKI